MREAYASMVDNFLLIDFMSLTVCSRFKKKERKKKTWVPRESAEGMQPCEKVYNLLIGSVVLEGE